MRDDKCAVAMEKPLLSHRLSQLSSPLVSSKLPHVSLVTCPLYMMPILDFSLYTFRLLRFVIFTYLYIYLLLLLASALACFLSSPVRMKSNTGKRKCEDVDITERRVTRSISAGKRSTKPKNTNSSSSSDEIDNDKQPGRSIGRDGNYYECEMCDKVGRLLCCESCPRAYHLKCLGLETIPEGHWQCPSCCDDFSRPIKYLLRDSVSKESKPAAPKLKYTSASSLSKRN